MQEHSRAYIPVAHHKTFMRFHLCCWPLTANRAYGQPREERICPLLCVANEVGYENHVLTRCKAYDQLRTVSEIEFSAGRYAEYDPSQVSRVTSCIYKCCRRYKGPPGPGLGFYRDRNARRAHHVVTTHNNNITACRACTNRPWLCPGDKVDACGLRVDTWLSPLVSC